MGGRLWETPVTGFVTVIAGDGEQMTGWAMKRWLRKKVRGEGTKERKGPAVIYLKCLSRPVKRKTARLD